MGICRGGFHTLSPSPSLRFRINICALVHPDLGKGGVVKWPAEAAQQEGGA